MGLPASSLFVKYCRNSASSKRVIFQYVWTRNPFTIAHYVNFSVTKFDKVVFSIKSLYH